MFGDERTFEISPRLRIEIIEGQDIMWLVRDRYGENDEILIFEKDIPILVKTLNLIHESFGV